MSAMQEELQYLRRLNAQKTHLAVHRRRSRDERKSISKMIRASSVLLINPENRPSRTHSMISEDLASVLGPFSDIDVGEPMSVQDLAESRRGSIIEHQLESEVDSDEEKDEVILQPKFLKMGTVLIVEPESDKKSEQKSALTRESHIDDHEEIGLLQEQLTAINVQFKELQIQNIEKDHIIISLEKNLQEKINAISRMSDENQVLSKCREELLAQSKELVRLEHDKLELEAKLLAFNNSAGSRSKRVRARHTSMYISLDDIYGAGYTL